MDSKIIIDLHVVYIVKISGKVFNVILVFLVNHKLSVLDSCIHKKANISCILLTSIHSCMSHIDKSDTHLLLYRHQPHGESELVQVVQFVLKPQSSIVNA